MSNPAGKATEGTATQGKATEGTTLALDIGGTKIAYGFIDDANPTSIHHQGSVPSQPPGVLIADQVDLAIRNALEKAQPTRVGIGAPGVVRAPMGEIIYNGGTIPGWAGTDLSGIVHRYTPAPVACHNDVRIWAYGEHHLGAGKNFPADARLLYLSLGTGVGGAFIVPGGHLAPGPTGSAGEVSELVCADCRGQADRVENIASGPSLARYYATLAADPMHQGRIPWADPNECPFNLPQVMELYDAGDALAIRVIEGNLRGLGRMLGALASALDLSGIVLGGGVSHIGERITNPIAAGLKEAALTPNKNIPLVRSRLGAHAPLIAAAQYARDNAQSTAQGNTQT